MRSTDVTHRRSEVTNITEGEKSLLTAIRDSEYHDGRDPVDDDVWVDCLDGWSGSRNFPGTMASLVKKGLAATTGEVCSITSAGLEALR